MKQIFNANWQFLKMGIDTSPEDMRKQQAQFAPVDIPHDWLIFDTANLYEDGRGWYRKKTHIDYKDGDHVFLYFEAVYMDTEIYINGKKTWEWKYGYSSFEVEITPYLTGGEEEILVSVSHRSPNTRWYSGAGIFRDIYLKVVPETYFVTDGLYVSAKPGAEENPAGAWEVKLAAEVAGKEAAGSRVTFRILREGNVVGTAKGTVSEKTVVNPAADTPWYKAQNEQKKHAAQGQQKVPGATLFEATLEVEAPELWDVESPKLYFAEAILENGEREAARFGFKTMKFDPDRGFFLNGRWLKLHGACEHHDLGCLGAAYYSAAMRRKFQTLQEMGVNAVRTTHNMPAKDLMDLADEMGMLIVAEGFDMWEMPKTTYDYARFFKEWAESDVASWVRRDRNHASLMMWSIGNEIYDTHFNEHGYEITADLKKWVEDNDYLGNAPVTIGSNFLPWENTQKCVDLLKLAGYNYLEKCYDEHHEKYPDWVIYGSETASVVHSRGIYHFPLKKLLLADDDEQCSALGNSTTSWGAESVEKCITDDRDASYCMGQFIWTGFDYIGEPTPYKTKNSYYGQIDTAGFPKDAYYTFRAEWTDYRQKPMVHLFPHWDFNPGQLIDVRVCSNAPSVELFFNGESLGRRNIDHAKDKNLIQDWQILYTPGELVAVAYDENGREIARERRVSFGDTAALTLSADKEQLVADGRDLAFVTISAVDKEGNPVENGADYVNVSVTGAGRLIGLDNGDSTDYDSYKGTRRKLFSGKLLAVIGATKEAGEICVTVTGDDLTPVELRLQAALPEGEVYSADGMVWMNPAEVPVGLQNKAEVCPSDKKWIRKIEIQCPEGQLLSGGKKQMEVTAKLYPEDAQYREIEWSAVTASGIASPIAKVEGDGTRALLTGKADGEFMLRCTAKNGTDKVKLISQVEFKAEGLGKPFLDPYEFVSGGLCNCTVGDIGNGNEKGVSSGHERSQIGFVDVDFGEFGSDEITIPIFALDAKPYQIEIWEGMADEEGSEKLADVVYQKPSIWAVYQPETYKLSRKMKGLTTLCLVFYAKVHVKGFSFTKPKKAFCQLLASDCSRVYGDSFVKKGDAIEKIGNNVALEYTDMNFEQTGASKVFICGRTPLDKNTIHIRFTGEQGTETQIVEFGGKSMAGAECDAGNAACEDACSESACDGYTVQEFALETVTGMQKVELVFLPGSNFDLKWLRFEESALTIRRAQDTDMARIDDLLFQVLEVHHQGRPDLFKGGVKKYTDEELLEILKDDKRPVFVAEDENGTVQGYAFCVFIRREDNNILTDIKTLYIDDLCVDETARGQKVGKRLYEYVLDFARRNDCYNVTLNVWSCNESAMKFYEKCGLKPQKVGMEVIL